MDTFPNEELFKSEHEKTPDDISTPGSFPVEEEPEDIVYEDIPPKGDIEEASPKGEVELVPVKEVAVPAPESLVAKVSDAIEVVEKLQKYYKVIRKAAISATTYQDWTNWAGKFRLNESGAAKIMAQLGIREIPIETRKEYFTGGYTFYSERRYIPSWNPSSEFVAVGSCRSDDPFFGTYRVFDPDSGRKVARPKPVDDVDESNILKSSVANVRVNGVTAVTGLKTVTIEELAACGISIGQIERVDFASGGGNKSGPWKPSDKQRAFAKRLGGVDSDIDECRSNHDFNNLIDKLKKGGGGGGDF